MNNDIEALVRAIKSNVLAHDQPPWPGGWPGEAEAAIIDSVCSIQARYGGPDNGVRKQVKDWRRHRGEQRLDDLRELRHFAEWNSDRADPLASKTGGRPKAAVIAEVAAKYVDAGISSASQLLSDPCAEWIWRETHGLGYATWRYVLLLLGYDTVKPDSMLTRYAARTLDRPVSQHELVELVTAAAAQLEMKASHLDHAIWRFERSMPG